MPTGARHRTVPSPSLIGHTSAEQGPLPFEQLLRSDGSRGPLDVVVAQRCLAADAAAVLAAVGQGGGPGAWDRTGFARRVEAARRQLAPIGATRVLAESFRREACVGAGMKRSADAVRVAYAMRWLELTSGRALPPLHRWMAAPPTA